MTRFQVLYWQDVPSVVRILGEDGEERAKHQLPEWFQQEIDRRAMAQGLVGSDAYLEAWSWSEPRERPEEPGSLAEAIAAEFRAGGA